MDKTTSQQSPPNKTKPKKTKLVCSICKSKPPQLKRPKTLQKICKDCFYSAFETEIHETIISNKLFQKGETVAIAVSGGKDSTVLAHVLSKLNKEKNYGLNLVLLSIDEGIKGYRDDSLETVKHNSRDYKIPLTILSFKKLFGWSLDEIVKQIGLNNNCTFCGVFRRKALDIGCELLKVDKMVTGHNGDDMAETVYMNLLRGDISRLQRCVNITTHDDGGGKIPRVKPFKYTYEKEIVLYAYYKKLEYFCTECTYSPNAFRGYARELIKDLEKINPLTILNIIKSAESFKYNQKKIKKQKLRKCEKCGYLTSQKICRACIFVESLNSGQAKVILYENDNQKIKKKDLI